MKHTIIAIPMALLLASCSGGSSKAPELMNQTDTLSWAYGQNIADALQKGWLQNLDADLVLKSAIHSLKGGEQPLTAEETKQALDYIVTMYNTQVMREANQQEASVDARQKEYFDKLLSENSKVKQHPSGFCYEVIRPGKGPNAKLAQRIRFDYRSYFLFTSEAYDQTYGKREPIVHVVGQPMFPGLIDAFQLMNAGSIYRFYFPYQLAFGPNGAGSIPGFTPLIYEIELHDLYEN